SLRIAAANTSKCEQTQTVNWRGGQLLVSLFVRSAHGAVPRVCLMESGPDHCAPVPGPAVANSWSSYRISLDPEVGTRAVRLSFYVDGAESKHASAEFARVSVLEVIGHSALTLVAEPNHPTPHQLLSVHTTYS